MWRTWQNSSNILVLSTFDVLTSTHTSTTHLWARLLHIRNDYQKAAVSLGHDLFWFWTGAHYLEDCPVEPNIPVYLLVGGIFSFIHLVCILWRQVRSRRLHTGENEEFNQASYAEEGFGLPRGTTQVSPTTFFCAHTPLSVFIVVIFFSLIRTRKTAKILKNELLPDINDLFNTRLLSLICVISPWYQ